MKKTALLAISLALLSSTALAGGDMKNAMAKLQAMGECMNKLDQKQMQDIADRSKQMMAEADTLCKAGKRDEAKALMEKFGQDTANLAIAQEMKKCGEAMKPADDSKAPLSKKAQEIRDMHICDRLEKGVTGKK
jgi:hypothetical protein